MDLPAVLAFQVQVLTNAGAVPRCHRVAVAVDLREDWPAQLVAAGFQPATPTVWLLEGLLIYLTADEATTLLRAVTWLSGSAVNARPVIHDSDRQIP